MLCENCKKNLATVFLNFSEFETEKELYLCQKCAEEKQFFKSTKKEIFTKTQNNKVCVCGASFKDIAESGFVRCKECYDTFEKELSPIIFALHSKTTHIGKRKLSKLELLLEQLQKAKENNFLSLAKKIEAEILSIKGGENERL